MGGFKVDSALALIPQLLQARHGHHVCHFQTFNYALLQHPNMETRILLAVPFKWHLDHEKSG